MRDSDMLDLGLDLQQLTPEDAKKAWARLGTIEFRMVEKIGQCPHNLGDTFTFETPYKPPANVCYALLHVLSLYAWRVALGFPSWNADDRRVYRLHCPDATGTIWEMRRTDR